MKRFVTAFVFLLALLATFPAGASTFFMSPTGSDANPGTSSGSPWLSPNHSLNCNDVIIAAASSSYSATNFYTGKWGTVTCPSGAGVAWVQCATFDACKIVVTSGTNPAVWIDQNYWGIQGFEVNITGTANATPSNVGTVTFGTCFEAGVPSAGRVVNHIIFANNVANGCANGGFVVFNSGTTGGADYVVFIGNIAYNAAQGAHSCTSGFSIYQPVKSDSVAGTHFFLAGNYAWNNINPSACNGTAPTDGEGIILDTFDFSQGGGTAYDQQAYVTQNLVFMNGGRGIEVFNNQTGSSHAPVYVKYNTMYGDMLDNNQTGGCLGRAELAIGYTKNTTYDHNIGQTRTGTSCSSGALFATTVETGDGSDVVTNNWYYSAAGNNLLIDASPGFSLGTGNVSGSSPVFTSIPGSVPGAPSCGASVNTAACVATLIADFVPTASTSTNYGYQPVSNTSVTDSLFPAWICAGGSNTSAALNSLIPTGLITPGCGVAGGGGIGAQGTFYNGKMSNGVLR